MVPFGSVFDQKGYGLPICMAVSVVIGWILATPRTPSVPNSFRVVCFGEIRDVIE